METMKEFLRRACILPKTVDTALARFRGAVKNLEAVAQRELDRAHRSQAVADAAAKDAVAALKESTRATSVADKLVELLEIER